MNIETMVKADEEAVRFRKAVEALRLKMASDSYAFMGCPESGALRRASMDLTRALATLRR